jgi:hypothetical protein
MQKLQAFDDTIAWINKEEGLFQFPVSTYPELDELKVCSIFLKIAVLWDVMQSSLVDSYQIFRGTCYHHLH